MTELEGHAHRRHASEKDDSQDTTGQRGPEQWRDAGRSLRSPPLAS